MIVVYKFANTATGEFYIGSTNDFDKRVRQHLYRLRNNKQERKDPSALLSEQPKQIAVGWLPKKQEGKFQKRVLVRV